MAKGKTSSSHFCSSHTFDDEKGSFCRHLCFEESSLLLPLPPRFPCLCAGFATVTVETPVDALFSPKPNPSSTFHFQRGRCCLHHCFPPLTRSNRFTRSSRSPTHVPKAGSEGWQLQRGGFRLSLVENNGQHSFDRRDLSTRAGTLRLGLGHVLSHIGWVRRPWHFSSIDKERFPQGRRLFRRTGDARCFPQCLPWSGGPGPRQARGARMRVPTTPRASGLRPGRAPPPHALQIPQCPARIPQRSPRMRTTLYVSKMADAATGGSGTRAGGKQASTPADNYYLARRRTLQVVVSSLLTEAGFESAEKAAVETLTEMLQSYISEMGRSAKSYCEHTARTQPTLSDIVVTLVEMGFNVETLPAYAKRSQRMVITAPPVTNQPVTPKALTAGQNKPHPSHIPSHFPEFPDPHTYIKTPTYREPVSDYQVLREKAASQRRDVERALTRFMAKTGETQSLFKDDVSTFPLIAARPFTVPYLTALLPSELEMQQMEETDSSEQDDQTDTENLPLHMSTDDSGPEKENASVLQQNTSLSGSRNGEENMIDNPYLRPVKKPKIRRKK